MESIRIDDEHHHNSLLQRNFNNDKYHQQRRQQQIQQRFFIQRKCILVIVIFIIACCNIYLRSSPSSHSSLSSSLSKIRASLPMQNDDNVAGVGGKSAKEKEIIFHSRRILQAKESIKKNQTKIISNNRTINDNQHSKT